MTVRVQKESINLREKLSELDKPSGIAGQDILKADTPQEVFNYIGAGRRNLIINGAMQISQRGDYTSATSCSSSTYYLDRHKTELVTVTGTVQDTTGKIKYTATSSGTGQIGGYQIVEMDNYYKGKTFTASVKMTSNNSSAGIAIYDGVGFIGATKHSGGGSEETLTVTGTTSASATQLVLYYKISGTTGGGSVTVTSGDYIEIGDIQLEVGSVATPFEHRSYGEELALCQRYYFKMYSEDADNAFYGSGFAHTTTAAGGVVFFPVEMRARPTSLYQSGTASDYRLWHGGNLTTNCSSVPVYSGATRTSCRVIFTVSSGLTVGGGVLLRATNTNSYLAWESEL